MKTAKVAALLASGAVLGWVLIVPAIVGVHTEDKIRHDIDSLQQSRMLPWKVTVDNYERGWFASSARVSYSLPVAGQVLRFAVDYKVNQFAVPFWRWARTDYTITPLDATGSPAGGPLALEAYSIKTFWGRTDTTLHADELNWGATDGNAVSMRKLLASISTEEGKPMQYKLSMAGFSLRSPLPQGSGVLQLVAANLQADGHQASATTAKDSWQMDSKQKLESLELLVDNNSIMRMGGIGVDASMQDKGSTVDMVYRSRAEKAQLGPINHAFGVKEVRMDFSYVNINKQGYADWQSRSSQLYANAGSMSTAALEQAAADALLKSAGSLLGSSPAFRIEQLGFQTDKGMLRSTLELRFDGNGMPAGELTVQTLLPLLRDRLGGKASVQLDRGLLNEIAAQAGGIDAAGQSAQMVEASIHSAVQQGWLSDNGQRLNADFSFSRDGASLNGHPLPAMGSLLGGAPAAMPASPAPAQAAAEPAEQPEPNLPDGNN